MLFDACHARCCLLFARLRPDAVAQAPPPSLRTTPASSLRFISPVTRHDIYSIEAHSSALHMLLILEQGYYICYDLLRRCQRAMLILLAITLTAPLLFHYGYCRQTPGYAGATRRDIARY